MKVALQGERLDFPSRSAEGTANHLLENLSREIMCEAEPTDRKSFDVLYNILHEKLRAINRAENVRSNEIPDSYLCPISFCIMTDPVICSDGHTYERASIEEWFLTSRRSPYTNLELESLELIPNILIRNVIQRSGLL